MLLLSHNSAVIDDLHGHRWLI